MICIVQRQDGSERHRQVFWSISFSCLPHFSTFEIEEEVIGIRFSLISKRCRQVDVNPSNLDAPFHLKKLVALSVMERLHSPSASMWPDKDFRGKKRVNDAKNGTVTRS